MGGLGHDLKVGGNWIHEPHLFATFNGGATPQLHAERGCAQRAGPAGALQRRRRRREHPARPVRALRPGRLARQRPADAQSRPALRLRRRHADRPGAEPELRASCRRRARPAASRTSRCSKTSASAPRNDRDNIAAARRLRLRPAGNGRDVIRGGWGVYTDFGYTNSNVLFAAIDAAGGHGPVFFVSNPAGIRKADGAFFTAGDPLSSIASQNEVDPTLAPLFGQVVSPRLEQPYTRQTNLGWAHQIDAVDGADGRTTCASKGATSTSASGRTPRSTAAAPAAPDLPHPPEHAVLPHRRQRGREPYDGDDHRAASPHVAAAST